MTMQTGDKVTIRRGKLKGEAGEVKMVQGDKVALLMNNGELEVVNRSNIKEPIEATITQDELAALINSLPMTANQVYVADLVHNIDAKYPGFVSRVSFSVVSTPDAGVEDPRDAGPY